MLAGRLQTYHIAFILLVSLAAIICLFGLGAESLWYDEAHTAWLTQRPAFTLFFTSNQTHPPLYFLLAKWCEQALGPTEFALRLPAALGGIGVTAFAFLLARRLAGTAAGVAAGLLTAFAPVLVWYSQEARPYQLAAFFAIGSVYFLLRWQENPQRRGNLALCALLGLGGLLTYYYFIFFLLAQNILVLARWGLRRNWSVLRDWLAAQGVIGLAQLARAPAIITDVTYASQYAYQEPWANALGTTFEWVGHTHPRVADSLIPILIIWGLAALGALVSWRQGWKLALAASAAAAPLVGAMLGHWWFGLPTAARHGILAAPFIYVLAGVGLAHLWPTNWDLRPFWIRLRTFLKNPDLAAHLAFKRPALLGILGFALRASTGAAAGVLALVLIWHDAGLLRRHYSVPDKEEWRAVSTALLQDARPGDAVYLYPAYQSRSLAFYLGEQPPFSVNPKGAPKCQNGLDLWVVTKIANPAREPQTMNTLRRLQRECSLVSSKTYAGGVKLWRFAPL